MSGSENNDLDRLPRLLSPSRASDFEQCAQKFKFGSIERLRTPSTPEQLRGTLAHDALEQLFMHHRPGERTMADALTYLEPAWAKLREQPDVAHIVARGPEAEAEIVTYATRMVENYFGMENPNAFDPVGIEIRLQADVAGVPLHGIIDRMDRVVMPSGAVRWYISDYKGLAVDTALPTPTGWTTMGDVAVGDELYGADGNPCRVTVKSGVHNRVCYRIHFDDDTTIVCDHVHLWSVRIDGAPAAVVDTDQLVELHREGRRLSIDNTDAIAGTDWNGDPVEAGRGIAAGEGVPVHLLRAAADTRREALEAVLDALDAERFEGLDVVCATGAAAAAVGELTVSLGGTVTAGEKFELHLRGWRADAERGERRITRVSAALSVPTQCVKVDSPDSLYLAGRQMVPTHNTGKVPAPDDRFLDGKFFAMKVYAVMAKEMLGIDVHELRLIYLAGGSKAAIRTMAVDERLIERTTAQMKAMWRGIKNAARKGEWPTRTGPLCGWCDFQEICPAFHPELEGLEISDLVEHAGEAGVSLAMPTPRTPEVTAAADGNTKAATPTASGEERPKAPRKPRTSGKQKAVGDKELADTTN